MPLHCSTGIPGYHSSFEPWSPSTLATGLSRPRLFAQLKYRVFSLRRPGTSSYCNIYFVPDRPLNGYGQSPGSKQAESIGHRPFGYIQRLTWAQLQRGGLSWRQTWTFLHPAK
ncbi:hypothetical protein MGG_17289 [Pyricularia oryzae 70-15]|uniref:Uncharacterized protein n=3 Tax=Pyricularia oryzae TaxID=318829 RepID=G4NBJ1_PYRO7|nr:uncharacterized protein MGG_17289 [Pyricularia oryzae 70-15]EHA48096.1 hypothetical protein MGG_17289 [Pyricularia oryzae 70-15]ELQ32793.1 hypothetical protein OOU_Y34scaffold01036g3 [Pyricularia oryzae Y34]